MQVLMLYSVIGMVMASSDNADLKRIEPTVRRNSNGSVTSSYYLNDTFWQLELTTEKYRENITVYRVQNGSISTEDASPRQCHYRGTIAGNPLSTVALSICEDEQMHGKVFDGQDVYSFSYYNGTQYVQRYPQLVRNSSSGKSIHDWGKCARKTVPVRIRVEIVVSSRLFMELDQKVVEFCLSIVNIVNALMAELNIFIDLTTIVIWTDKDYMKMTEKSTKMLPRFTTYISHEMPGRDAVDFVVFFTPLLSTEGVAFLGSMGLRNGSGMIVRTDPQSVVISALTFFHELLHLLGVGHDQYSEDFLMTASERNHANAMLSTESVLALNKNMPEEMVGRLRQKGQQWTPIVEHCEESFEEPKRKDSLPWWLIPGIVVVIGAVIWIVVSIGKSRRSSAQSAEKSTNSDLEAATTMESEPSAGAVPKKNTADRLSTSLTDSGVTDNRSTLPPTRDPSCESVTSGHASPSQVTFTSEDDSS